VLAVLLAAGCSECAPPEDELAIRKTLATGLPPGSSREAVRKFFVAHGWISADAPDVVTAVRFPIEPADTRWQCSVVTSTVDFRCQYDGDGRLRECTAEAERTGP
jgi:hypothetical protein